MPAFAKCHKVLHNSIAAVISTGMKICTGLHILAEDPVHVRHTQYIPGWAASWQVGAMRPRWAAMGGVGPSLVAMARTSSYPPSQVQSADMEQHGSHQLFSPCRSRFPTVQVGAYPKAIGSPLTLKKPPACKIPPQDATKTVLALLHLCGAIWAESGCNSQVK